ncbi:MAG: LysR family transcriptional regulator [Pseudomonadota bacterium]
MITLDANLLPLLVAVAQYGSFNRAALALGMSQPAFSVKIGQLEHQVGVRLVERGARGAALTAYGETLLHHAKTIETVRERAAAELSLLQRGVAGTLAIGATPIALVNLVPEAVGQLDREFERLSVTVAEGPDTELNERLRRRELDIVVGVVGIDAHTPDIEESALIRDRLDLVVRRGSDLDKRQSVKISQLHDRHWALPTPGSSFQRQVESLFIIAGLPLPESKVLCTSLLAIRRMTILGDWLAILPRHAVHQDVRDRLVVAIPIAGPGTVRHIGYRMREGERPRPLVQRFIELLAGAAKRQDTATLSK